MSMRCAVGAGVSAMRSRSEEHTSELQSHVNLVCRLLLEKKNSVPINPSQRVKIFSPDGPVERNQVAGSGYSRVHLTRHTRLLTHSHVEPERNVVVNCSPH